MRAIAVTSIADQASSGIQRLFAMAEVCSAELIVIGDKKTPEWSKLKLPNFVHYFSLEDQLRKWPNLARLLPVNHYARKNLAYLWAIENEAEVLLDTDDDNYSKANLFDFSITEYRMLLEKLEWVNVYAYFGQSRIWPRGLPLDEAMKPQGNFQYLKNPIEWHCFQSIVDVDPDLDAVGRMLYPQIHIFEDLPPLFLKPGQFCPTNSQATLWKKEIFPFLYLPVTAPFRMTDIWRGILISSLMHAKGFNIFFGKLGIEQQRNYHSLISDFRDEVAGHLYNKEIKTISENEFQSNSSLSELQCFKNIFQELTEMRILDQYENECFAAYLEHI